MIEKYFTKAFTILSRTDEKTDGVMKSTWTESISGTCHFEPLSTAIVFDSGKIKTTITHRAFMAFTNAIKELDKMVIDNKEYKVIQVQNAAGMGRHTEVLLNVF